MTWVDPSDADVWKVEYTITHDNDNDGTLATFSGTIDSITVDREATIPAFTWLHSCFF